MGEAKAKLQARDRRLAAEPRCIYCSNAATTVEHMPPITLFRARRRPKGLEFAACQECNNDTRGADLVASYISRLSRESAQERWLIEEAAALHVMLDRRVPGFRAELMRDNKRSLQWVPGRGGILERMQVIKADGELIRRHLTTFGAKLGMALYREHLGSALPLTGAVHVRTFLNAGLSGDRAERLLSILPINGELRQGQMEVREQFAYRYNTDEKSIFAGMVGFHSNFHLFLVAVADAVLFEQLDMADDRTFIRPGELVQTLNG